MDECDLLNGSRVMHGSRRGVIENFLAFTEDGVRYHFATVQFDDGKREGVDVDELDPEN